MRQINEIIVHCSATRPSWMEGETVERKRDEIRRWHVEENKWNDIGYHVVIDRDGTIAPGRAYGEVGAHAKGRNKASIGVCLIGGHGSNENDAFADNFTQEQNRALRSLIDTLRGEFPGIDKVSGHNEYSAKACPGFKVDRWLASKPPRRESPAQSGTIKATTIAGAASAGTGILAGVSDLHPIVQGLMIGGALLIVAMSVYIFRERLKKWAGGDR